MTSFYKFGIHSRSTVIALLLFLGLLGWWLALHFPIRATSDALQFWAASYQIIAIYGAIFGLTISARWGGFKSVLGRTIIAFSFGLLFQSLGQSIYSYYIYYLNQPVPYPSVGDVGFFGSIIFYLYGAWMLTYIAGVRVALRNNWNQILAVFIPPLLLIFSYGIFLDGYIFDWSQPIKIFFDFGYPLGQTLNISITILAFILSRQILGGIMRGPILIFIFALVAQYLSDFTFLYQASHGIWYAGGLNDLMYAISYLIMAISLIYIGYIFKQIASSQQLS